MSDTVGDPRDALLAGVDDRSDDEIVAGFADRGRTPGDRVAAIAALARGPIGRPAVLQALIRVLADGDDEPDARRAAQGGLAGASFAAAGFAAFEPDYRNALRSAASSTDPVLADRALEALALKHDDYAQSLIVDGLEDPGSARIGRARALQFLGYDLHAGHYPMLRDLAEHAGDPEEQITAVRLLATDSGSADVFRRLVDDRSQDRNVRAAGALALNSLDPDAFRATAREIVLDPDDDDDLRAVCLTALTVGGRAAPDGDEADLAEAVDAGPAPSAELARAVRRYRDVADRDGGGDGGADDLDDGR